MGLWLVWSFRSGGSGFGWHTVGIPQLLAPPKLRKSRRGSEIVTRLSGEWELSTGSRFPPFCGCELCGTWYSGVLSPTPSRASSGLQSVQEKKGAVIFKISKIKVYFSRGCSRFLTSLYSLSPLQTTQKGNFKLKFCTFLECS